MDEAGAAKLIMVMSQIYPSFKMAEYPKAQARAWAMVLRDMTYEQAEAALLAFAAGDNKGFAPAPGQIRAKAELLAGKGEEMTDAEAWGIVFEALGPDFRETEEAFAKLPTDIQSILGSAQTLRDWWRLDNGTLHTVIASNFMRAYRARVSRKQEYAAIPKALRDYGTNLFLGAQGAGRMDELELERRQRQLAEWGAKFG